MRLFSTAGRAGSLLLLSLMATVPAQAAAVLFAGPTGNSASVTRSSGDISFDVTALLFSAAPNALTNLSQLTGSGLVSIDSVGIGVAGGASNPQVDTNQPQRREALLLTANQAVSISGFQLSMIDINDTFQLYGVGSGGALTALGFDGLVRTGLGGAAAYVNSGVNGGTTALTLNVPTSFYNAFLLTTRVPGDINYGGGVGQGYRLDSLTANAVPEPATWAMFIVGFGLIGAAARRRTLAVVHA